MTKDQPTRETYAELFVGNINYTVDEAKLQWFFEQWRSIVLYCRIARDTEKFSRGFGWVRVPTHTAEGVIRTMNGKSLEGQLLRVARGKPRAADRTKTRDVRGAQTPLFQ
jgi:RNA recognition motif-containing protein